VTVWLVVYRIPNAMAVQRLEKEIRHRGEPMTLADVAAHYPPIPDADNGAAALLKIWEEDTPGFQAAFHVGLPESYSKRPRPDPVVPFVGGKIDRVHRTGALAVTNREAGEKFLKEHAERLSAFRTALQKSQFRFPVEITNGYKTYLPHLAELKFDVAFAFRLQALVAVEHGDVDGAIDALENIARTGNALADEPFLISQLVRIAFYQMVLDDMERLMSQRPLSPGQLEKLGSLLDRLRMDGALRTTVVAERPCMLSVFDLSPKPETPAASNADEEPSDQRGYRGIGILGPFGLEDADRRLMLETMGAALELADDNDSVSVRQWNKLFYVAGTKADHFPPRLFSAMLLPSWSGAKTRFVCFEARRRAAIVAVTVERYRLVQDGHLPNNLKQLIPQFLHELPEDPFSPLDTFRLKPLPTGFVVYSIGVDQVDDGGQERTSKQRGIWNGFDETFFVER
jgi:hypothetical protein